MDAPAKAAAVKAALLRWLDRYIHVDKLKFRRGQLLPRMHWWQWAWYVPAVMASALAFNHLDDWMSAQLEPVPVLNWVPWAVTWPVLGVVFWLVSRYLLPAREARLAAPGEAWLALALWVIAGMLEGVVTRVIGL